jgi:hypothetical protein
MELAGITLAFGSIRINSPPFESLIQCSATILGPVRLVEQFPAVNYVSAIWSVRFSDTG